jgi:hypothetical protein
VRRSRPDGGPPAAVEGNQSSRMMHTVDKPVPERSPRRRDGDDFVALIGPGGQDAGEPAPRPRRAEAVGAGRRAGPAREPPAAGARRAALAEAPAEVAAVSQGRFSTGGATVGHTPTRKGAITAASFGSLRYKCNRQGNEGAHSRSAPDRADRPAPNHLRSHRLVRHATRRSVAILSGSASMTSR